MIRSATPPSRSRTWSLPASDLLRDAVLGVIAEDRRHVARAFVPVTRSVLLPANVSARHAAGSWPRWRSQHELR